MSLIGHYPAMDEDDGEALERGLSMTPISDSSIMDDHGGVVEHEHDIDVSVAPPVDASEPGPLQQQDEAHTSQTANANSEQETQSQTQYTTDKEGEEITSPSAVPIESQNALTFDQKAFLVKKLMATQKRKFAKGFLSPAGPEKLEDSQMSSSLDLGVVLTKLLEDKYVSAEAFHDDVKAIAQRSTTESDKSHSKELRDHVDKFMKQLPKSQTSESDITIASTGGKRKADDETKNKAAAKKARFSGPSDAQQREMDYARKQAVAYREGKQSNTHKKVQNLVKDKIGDLEDEREKKRVEAAKRRHRIENTSKLMPKACQIEDKGSSPADNQGSNKNTRASHENDVNDDPLGQALASFGDEQDIATEQRRLAEQHNSSTGHRKERSSGKTKVIAKLKSYEESLSELSRDLPTQEQAGRLECASASGPNLLGRTAATIRGLNFGQYWRKTNGFTSHDVLLPAADSRSERYCSHERITDLSRAELTYMIGNHLIWKDLARDEFLSYSKDPLFLVVHALRRHHENQGSVTIQFLDRRKAKDSNGNAAKFYSALDLYTIFDVPKWSGWGSTDNIKLHPRKFTQEYLSHGPIVTPDTSFRQARIEELIKDGLYEIFPEFDAPLNHKRAGLYTLQVVYRKIGYPFTINDGQALNTHGRRSSGAKKTIEPIYSYENCARQRAMTLKLLTTVRKVTLNFINIPKDSAESDYEPPLHAFICFLTFEKRQKRDPVFVEWIKKHYSGKCSCLDDSDTNTLTFAIQHKTSKTSTPTTKATRSQA